MSDTPKERERAAEVLSAAFPDLTVPEVRRLLSKAQEVKRGEKDLGQVQREGQGLDIYTANRT